MGSYMQIFKNEQFGEVRMIEENGKPLFCGSDVARALGYARPNDRKLAAQAPCFSYGVSGALAGLVEEIPII